MLLPLKAIISKDTRKDGTSLISFQYLELSVGNTGEALRYFLGAEAIIEGLDYTDFAERDLSVPIKTNKNMIAVLKKRF